MSVFLDNDIKDLIRDFPSPKTHHGVLPSLLLASDGHSLVTCTHLEAELTDRISKGTQRLSMTSLARDLDVDDDVLVQLIQNNSVLALRTNDKRQILSQTERDALQNTLSVLLSAALVSKLEFSMQHDIDLKDVDILLEGLGAVLMHADDYVCSEAYRDDISIQISTMLEKSLEKLEAVSISPKNLSGNPPIWFITRALEGTLLQKVASKFSIIMGTDLIHCVPKRLVEKEREKVLNNLQSGALAYISLQKLLDDFPELGSTIEQYQREFEKNSGVEIIDTLAVSNVWILDLVNSCVKHLEQDGLVNVIQQIGSTAPVGVRDRIINSIIIRAASSFGEPLVPVGDFLLTASKLSSEEDALRDYANADATAQWQQLKNGSDLVVKFDISNIMSMIKSSEPVLKSLIQDKPTHKMLDEQFWASISKVEGKNEAEFVTFWTERIVLRFHLHNKALGAIEDQKLRDQLAELLVSFIQKELLPDTMAKARSLCLISSRKTRKNLEKLEAKLHPTEKLDAPGLHAALDWFNNKLAIEMPDTSIVEGAKATMLQDMKRRMNKQKNSDGPVLFLTVVILLVATRSPGVIYATGKFAPKLLKQLKADMAPETYQKLEAWKEAAKSNTLTAEDREGMKMITDA